MLLPLLLLACHSEPGETAGPGPADSPPPAETGSADSGTSGDSAGQADSADTGEHWPEGLVVLEPVTVIDAAGVREERALLLLSDTIWDLRPAGGHWPEDAEILDGTGLTVLPGLVDSHLHLSLSGSTWWVGDSLASNLRANLAWGVVAAVDVGGGPWLAELRDRIAAGEILGPRLRVSGPFLTAELSHPCEVWNDPMLCRYVDGDGAEGVAELVAEGVDQVKVALCDADFTPWPTPRLDLGDLVEITEAAHAAGLPVVAHVDQLDDATDALASGVDVLGHPPFDEPAGELSSLVDALSLNSTVGAFADVLRIVDGDDLSSERYRAVDPAVLDAWAAIQAHPDWLVEGWVEGSRQWAEAARANLEAALEAGVPVTAGSDAGYYFVPHGVGLHDELHALLDAGLSLPDALALATSVPAALWGWEELGWVAPGYRADLLVVRGRPDRDPDALEDIAWVVLGGEFHAPDELLAADLLLAPRAGSEGDFCLDDRDCASGRCDLVDHACREACDPPYRTAGACDAETWCMPQDGVSTTPTGVCHPGDPCDLYAQDCEPASYGDNCIPLDLDTNGCWPSGPRQEGEPCDYADPEDFCEQGLYCRWTGRDYRCARLCDPDEPGSCPRGRCVRQHASDGSPWYGLCL